DANDEEHQLGEEGAACSSNFAAEVSLNPTTSDIELPRSVERKQLIFDDQSQQCPAGSTRSQDSSQDCGPGDDRVDAACQTDFEDCAVGGSLLETSATMCSHYPMALAGTKVGGGEVMHSDLYVQLGLLQDMKKDCKSFDNCKDVLCAPQVNDLLNWRLLSQKTRSPKALLQHVAEMGSMERPASVIAFSDINRVNQPDSDTSIAAAFAGDFKSQKLYECRMWCAALARKRWTHFAESDVLSIVGKNLQNLLRHFQSADASLVAAARYVLFDYAFDGLYFVQQRVAVVMLDRLEDLVESSIISNLKEIVVMTRQLKTMLRSMSTAQRRKWASLLVKMLLDPSLREEPVIEELKILWLVEDNPRRTFAEAERQLRIFAKSASAAVRREMQDLIG
ncbi:AMT1-1, partial [Symbiodinium sp. KB8]